MLVNSIIRTYLLPKPIVRANDGRMGKKVTIREKKEFHIPSPTAIIALCPSEEHNLSFVGPVS